MLQFVMWHRADDLLAGRIAGLLDPSAVFATCPRAPDQVDLCPVPSDIMLIVHSYLHRRQCAAQISRKALGQNPLLTTGLPPAGATPSNSRHLVTATFGQRPVVAPFRANQTRRSLVASAVAGMVVPPAPVPKVRPTSTRLPAGRAFAPIAQHKLHLLHQSQQP